jgi:hypothetical protein
MAPSASTPADPVPPILWHYTSLDALLRIVSSESIWASDVRCLNDATEFEYGRQIATKVAEANQEARRFLEEAKAIASESRSSGTPVSYYSIEVSKLELFVFSMSGRDDLLSQWRSYCPPGAGCSIGLDSNSIARGDCGFDNNVVLIPCVYTELQQVTMTENAIETALRYARGPHRGLTGPALAAALGSVIPHFKHPSFQEECEWRLTQQRHGEDSAPDEKPIEYRMNKSMIVPYVKWSLKPLSITEIKLGPCPHPELSESTVKSLLATHKLAAAVTHSKIPYRAW